MPVRDGTGVQHHCTGLLPAPGRCPPRWAEDRPVGTGLETAEKAPQLPATQCPGDCLTRWGPWSPASGVAGVAPSPTMSHITKSGCSTDKKKSPVTVGGLHSSCQLLSAVSTLSQSHPLPQPQQPSAAQRPPTELKLLVRGSGPHTGVWPSGTPQEKSHQPRGQNSNSERAELGRARPGRRRCRSQS